jgi:hypothetical protein
VPALAPRLDGIPPVEDNKNIGAIGCPGATGSQDEVLRWPARQRYFAADRCVKEAVYLALESGRPWPQLEVGLAGDHDGRTVVTPPSVARPGPSKPNPSRPQTPFGDICGYPGLSIWRPRYPQFFGPFA